VAHISRKELKQDKIRESLEQGAEAVFSHQRLISWVIVAAAIVAAGVLGWRLYTERQTVSATVALDDAMKVFTARIRAAGEPAEPGEVTYVDEKNKFEDAAKKFGDVAKSYSRTEPGRLAAYYAALSLESLGRFNQAQEFLQKLADGGDVELAALARFQLAQTYGKTGKTDEAVKLYRQLADKPTVLVPRAIVQLRLAAALIRTNPQEASKLFNQIKKDYPESQISEEADRGLEAIGPKS
jgi:predicted negative regulator of RcsB-dependent stress response